MKLESKNKMLINGINITFFNQISPQKDTLIFIPGGPGLSSSYFNSFLCQKKIYDKWNVAVIDLPNHDNSKIFEKITFDKVSDVIFKTIIELKKICKSIRIFAHSLGGCLLMNSDICISDFQSLIFCDVPYKLHHSKKFYEEKQKLNLDKVYNLDANFAEYFSAISNLYFYDHSKYKIDDFFKNGFYWKNGKRIIENCQFDLTKTKKRFKSHNVHYLLGQFDIVLPSDNLHVIQESFEKKNIQIFKKSGHFPFIEEPESVFSTLETICV